MTTTTDIKLGMPVLTSDGKRIGKVARLIVDPDQQELLEIVVHQLFPIPVQRLVDQVDIDRVVEDTLLLAIDAEKARDLPRYSAAEYTVAVPAGASPVVFPLGAGPTTNQPILHHIPTGRHQMHAARTNLFQETVLEGGVVAVRSSLPDVAVVIDRGTDVITADGEKIGVVDEITFDDRGEITGLVVRSGLFTRHDLAIPIDRVEAITHRYVRLNVMSDEIGMEMAMELV